MVLITPVIAPSRFGYLGSTMPAGATVAAQADVYAALLDELGIDRLDVLAISSGPFRPSSLPCGFRAR